MFEVSTNSLERYLRELYDQPKVALSLKTLINGKDRGHRGPTLWMQYVWILVRNSTTPNSALYKGRALPTVELTGLARGSVWLVYCCSLGWKRTTHWDWRVGSREPSEEPRYE